MIAPAVQGWASSLVVDWGASKARHDESREAMRVAMQGAVEALVPPGTIIANHHAHALGFGTVSLSGGTARGAQRFEVAGPPRVEVDRSHLALTRFRIDAWPISEAGKRMSGRPGNGRYRGETVTLAVDLFASRGPDDNRTDTQLLAELLARALT